MITQYDQYNIPASQFQFSQVPLQPLMTLLQTKQQLYNQNLAEADALNEVLQADVLPGHMSRVNALNQELEDEIQGIATNYDGDYSRAGRDIQRMKRKISRLYSPTGEIGQYQALKNRYATIDQEIRQRMGKKDGPSASTYNLWNRQVLDQLNQVQFQNNQLVGDTNIENLMNDPQAIKMLEEYAKEFSPQVLAQFNWKQTPDGRFIKTVDGQTKILKAEDVYLNLLQRLGADSRIKDYYGQLVRLGDTQSLQDLDKAARAIALRTARYEENLNTNFKESQEYLTRLRHSLENEMNNPFTNAFINPAENVSPSDVLDYSHITGNLTDPTGQLIGSARESNYPNPSTPIVERIVASAVNHISNTAIGEDDIRVTLEEGRIKSPRTEAIVREVINNNPGSDKRKINKEVQKAIAKHKAAVNNHQRVSYGYSAKQQKQATEINKQWLGDSNFHYIDKNGNRGTANTLVNLAYQLRVDIEDVQKSLNSPTGAVNRAFYPGGAGIPASNEWRISAFPGVRIYQNSRNRLQTTLLNPLANLWDSEAAFEGTMSKEGISGAMFTQNYDMYDASTGKPLVPNNAIVKNKFNVDYERNRPLNSHLVYSTDNINWIPITDSEGNPITEKHLKQRALNKISR